MSDATETVLPPALLERIKGLVLHAEALAVGGRTGVHRSRRLGGGSEFTEYKAYEPGDDLRFLDWRIQARTGRDVVRRHQSDRTRDLQIVLDRSGSMGFGTTTGRAPSPWGPWPVSKWEAGRTLALAVAFLSLRQGDRVGLHFVERGGDGLVGTLLGPRRVPVRGGVRHVEELVTRVAGEAPTGRGDLVAVAADAAARARSADLLVVSDLLVDPLDGLLDVLAVQRARGRSVQVLHVVDPAEITFPYEEPTLFSDLEGDEELSANPREFARAYREEFAAFLEGCRVGCARRGIRYGLVNTGLALEEAVVPFLRGDGLASGR